MTQPEWKRSSYCDSSACVEVAFTSSGEVVAVRDSEYPDGPKLFFRRAAWAAFIAGAKDGEFDLEGCEADS